MPATPSHLIVKATVTGTVDVLADLDPTDDVPPAPLAVKRGSEYRLPIEAFPTDPAGAPIIPAGLTVIGQE